MTDVTTCELCGQMRASVDTLPEGTCPICVYLGFVKAPQPRESPVTENLPAEPMDYTANPIQRFFSYRHLPHDLQIVSQPFHQLAYLLAKELPRSPELSVALRKLLESKDAAVRAALPPTNETANEET